MSQALYCERRMWLTSERHFSQRENHCIEEDGRRGGSSSEGGREGGSPGTGCVDP